MHATSAATQKTPLSGSGIISDKITYIMSTGNAVGSGQLLQGQLGLQLVAPVCCMLKNAESADCSGEGTTHTHTHTKASCMKGGDSVAEGRVTCKARRRILQ